MNITPDLLKLYAIFLLITLIFIVFVLRATYMLLNKKDPINAIQLHPTEWKIFKFDQAKKEIKIRSVMS
jgi:hypothetical protein